MSNSDSIELAIILLLMFMWWSFKSKLHKIHFPWVGMIKYSYVGAILDLNLKVMTWSYNPIKCWQIRNLSYFDGCTLADLREIKPRTLLSIISSRSFNHHFKNHYRLSFKAKQSSPVNIIEWTQQTVFTMTVIYPKRSFWTIITINVFQPYKLLCKKYPVPNRDNSAPLTTNVTFLPHLSRLFQIRII